MYLLYKENGCGRVAERDGNGSGSSTNIHKFGNTNATLSNSKKTYEMYSHTYALT